MPSQCLVEPAVGDWRDRFIDLVCQDDDLVRTEFDALLDAVWPPPTNAIRGAPLRPPGNCATTHTDAPGAGKHQAGNRRRRPCQRSPPDNQTSQRVGEQEVVEGR